MSGVFLMLFTQAIICQLQPYPFFDDNMVLQRDKPIKIWGKACPNEEVKIQLGADIFRTNTKLDSTWLVILPPQKTFGKSLKLIISTIDTTITYSNILIGDVWLCIGQSNMEWPMFKEMHFESEIKNSHQSLLKFYNPVYSGKNTYNTPFNDSLIQQLNPNSFFKGSWQSCDSITLSQMSAVAFYFGKKIVEKTGIPIGLIHLAIGGAPLETFISFESMNNHKKFFKKTKGNWLENNNLPVWIRDRAKQNIGMSNSVPCDELGKNHAFKPGFVFESGILSIKDIQIKGFICYQGESNAQEEDRVSEYEALFQLMVSDYRKLWNNKNLPVYFAQLSSIDTIKYKGHLWPEFRNEQRKIALNTPNVWMAVTSDIGERNDVHPRNKRTVGERLSLLALNHTYGIDNNGDTPMPIKASYKNNKIIISFNKKDKLITQPYNTPLSGFSLDKNRFVDAQLSKNKIIIASKSKPKYVYYGWCPFSTGNLYNDNMIPSSTFKLRIK